MTARGERRDPNANPESRITEMRAAAFEALGRAYAPYSEFRVGAALLGTDGTIGTGCNIENASYPASLCAERAAVATMVTQGVRDFALLVLATDAESPTPPCGFCRQVLAEFAPGLPIVSVTRNGREARWSLAELLPVPFTPLFLNRA